jgi:hypothetical protein
MKPVSEAQRIAMYGHAAGSVAAGMSLAERKRWKEWLRAKHADSAAFEAQLAGKKHRTHNPYVEV